MLGGGGRGLDVAGGLLVVLHDSCDSLYDSFVTAYLHIDRARVTHPHRVTRLHHSTVLNSLTKIFLDFVSAAHLAQREDDVLVVLADVVHAGVVPGRDVMLRNVTVRRVTLVIPLSRKQRLFQARFIDVNSHPLANTIFISCHNDYGEDDDS